MGNVPQHFPQNFQQNFPQEFPARISHKIFPQEFPTRFSHKNFPQEFPARISHKIFPQDFRYSVNIHNFWTLIEHDYFKVLKSLSLTSNVKLAQSGRLESVVHKRSQNPRVPGSIFTGGTSFLNFSSLRRVYKDDNIANCAYYGKNSNGTVDLFDLLITEAHCIATTLVHNQCHCPLPK